MKNNQYQQNNYVVFYPIIVTNFFSKSKAVLPEEDQNIRKGRITLVWLSMLVVTRFSNRDGGFSVTPHRWVKEDCYGGTLTIQEEHSKRAATPQREIEVIVNIFLLRRYHCLYNSAQRQGCRLVLPASQATCRLVCEI